MDMETPEPVKSLHLQAMSLADGTTLFVTVHPSSLLRIQDDNDKQKAYRRFVADLKKAVAEVSSG
jgi:uracil-DNA glycosylase